MRLTKQRKAELTTAHTAWVENPHASRGQKDDSKTILELLGEIGLLEESRDRWMDEYFEVSKFATAYETERDKLKAELQLAHKLPYLPTERMDHFNRVADTNKMLRSENVKLKDTLSGTEIALGRQCRFWEADVAKRDSRIKKLRSALTFYAERDHGYCAHDCLKADDEAAKNEK